MIKERLLDQVNPYRVECSPFEFGSKSDIVFIRRPSIEQVPEAAYQTFMSRLRDVGFVPVSILPNAKHEYDDSYIFPTDSYREVGPHVVYNTTGEWDSVTDYLRLNYPSLANRITVPQLYQTNFTGGDYVYHANQGVFVYADNRVVSYMRFGNQERDATNDPEVFVNTLATWGISQIIPVNTENVRLPVHPGKTYPFEADLDFLLSLYQGKDGQLHAIVAESMLNRLPEKVPFVIHTISDREASYGGCNIADLRGGKVLVLPDPTHTAQTHQIIEDFPPDVEVIIAPFDYVDGGGPRCSMSSVSLKTI